MTRLSLLGTSASAVGILSAVLLALPMANAQPAATPLCPDTGSHLILPGDRVGALPLGVSPADALAVTGTIGAVTQGVRHVGPVPEIPYTISYEAGPSTGVTLTFLEDQLLMITLLRSPGLASCETPDHIHLGSTATDVLHAYGRPDHITAAPGGRFPWWLYDHRGLMFAFDSFTTTETVSQLSIFPPDQYCLITKDSRFGCQ